MDSEDEEELEGKGGRAGGNRVLIESTKRTSQRIIKMIQNVDVESKCKVDLVWSRSNPEAEYERGKGENFIEDLVACLTQSMRLWILDSTNVESSLK